jgi:serine/threonine protein kinase
MNLTAQLKLIMRFREVLEQHMNGDGQHEGYSKAVDIWSIGCLTAFLLTGQLLFPEQRDVDARSKQHKRPPLDPSKVYDLRAMETGDHWQHVGRKAKSFVKQCVMEESCRLTAEEALQHSWFTNPHYAEELEAAYQRAIQDWEPRSKNTNVIESINTQTDPAPSGKDLTSPHFQGPPVPSQTTSLFFKNHAKVSNPSMLAPAAHTASTGAVNNLSSTTGAGGPLSALKDCELRDTIVPEFTQPTALGKCVTFDLPLPPATQRGRSKYDF